MRIFDSSDFDGHITPAGHAERVERLASVRAALAPLGWPVQEPRLATREELLRLHTPEYVDRILALDGQSLQLDEDTWTSPGTVRAALRSAGSALEAAALLEKGESSFAICRPPGHHASRGSQAGFCFFNNAALAADHLVRAGFRTLVFDPDVHHGDGTQDVIWDREGVLFVSMHGYPLWPGTGTVEEVGFHGHVVNCPMPEGSGDAEYRAAFEARVRPAIQDFRPERVVISAGFDAMAGDPLADARLSPEGIAWLWRQVLGEAQGMAVLEGGYNLDNLRAGVSACAPLLAAR